MSKVRLLRDSGAIQVSSQETDKIDLDNAPAFLEKDALLCYEGEFASMDGPVEITVDIIRKIIKNHNGFLSKLKRMVDTVGLHRYCPPLQLDHETKATHTVGRLTGELYEAPYVRVEDGESVVGLYGRGVRVLGKENTIKVLDGRWVNLSIGADLETGILSELTITPFPAAPEAKLLKDGTRMAKATRNHLGVEYTIDGEPGKFQVIIKLGPFDLTDQKFTFDDSVASSIMKVERIIDGLDKDGMLEKTPVNQKTKDSKRMVNSSEVTGYIQAAGKAYAAGNDSLGDQNKRKAIEAGKKIGMEPEKVEESIETSTKAYKKDNLSSGGNMFEKLMAYLTGSKRLSKEEAMKKMAEANDEEKKKLSEESEKDDEDKKKLAEEEAEKAKLAKEDEEKSKLAAMDEDKKKKEEEMKAKLKKRMMDDDKLSDSDADEKISKMSAEDIEKEDKKGEDSDKEKMKSKLSAAQDNVKKLGASLKAKKDLARLAARKSRIGVRLNALRADGKITPAEIKKIDIAKLSAGTDAELQSYMQGFDDREPVIFAGVMGSTKAVNLAKIESDKKSARMASEMMGNMPFTKKALENTAKLSGDTKNFSTLSRLAEERDVKEDNEHHLSDLPSHKELSAMIDESVTDKEKAETLKKHLGALCKYARAANIDGDKHLAESVDEVEKHLSEIEEDSAELEKAVAEVEKLSK